MLIEYIEESLKRAHYEMIGNSYLIDTNIAIYLLSGDKKIAEVLDKNLIYKIHELDSYCT